MNFIFGSRFSYFDLLGWWVIISLFSYISWWVLPLAFVLGIVSALLEHRFT